MAREVKRQKLDCVPKSGNELPVKKGPMLNFLVPKEQVKATDVNVKNDKPKAAAKKEMKKSVSTEVTVTSSK